MIYRLTSEARHCDHVLQPTRSLQQPTSFRLREQSNAEKFSLEHLSVSYCAVTPVFRYAHSYEVFVLLAYYLHYSFGTAFRSFAGPSQTAGDMIYRLASKARSRDHVLQSVRSRQ